MAYRAETPSLRARLSLARPVLLRAGMLGLCIGLVIIGLMENVTRFGSPESLRSDARIAPAALTQTGGPAPLREDRLDMAVRAETPVLVTLR